MGIFLTSVTLNSVSGQNRRKYLIALVAEVPLVVLVTGCLESSLNLCLAEALHDMPRQRPQKGTRESQTFHHNQNVYFLSWERP